MKFKLFISFWLFVSFSQCVAETLKVATINLAPFGFIDSNGISRGIFYDLANRIAEEASISVQNNVLPYARVLHELERGSADITILLPNERIKEIAFVLEPVMTLENVVIGLHGIRYQHYEDLWGKTLGSIREAIYDETVSDNERIQIFYTNSYQQSIRMLLAKRFDGIIGVKRSINFELSNLGHPPDVLGTPMHLNKREAWVHISKASRLSKKTLERVRGAVKKLVNTGHIEQVLTRY